MMLALSFHAGDRACAEQWFAWVAELGGMGSHRLFVMPAKGVAMPPCPLPHTVVQDHYGIVTNWSGNEAMRDASGANSMVRQFAFYFQQQQLGAWMFIEPDAIPLRPGWHDEIATEYAGCGKAFMGAKINGVTGQYPDHATGNMVLPQNAALVEKLMVPTRAPNGYEVAFDVAAAPMVLSNFHNTTRIQQIFRGEPFRSQADLGRIRPEACIFHNDKSGSLIAQLRASRNPIGFVKYDGPTELPVTYGPIVFLPTGMEVQILKPVVHTYAAWSSHAETRAEQERVVELWRKNWTDAGWDAQVLTEADAKRHPEYEKFRSGFEKLPIKNPKEYEMACFMRWVAMATLEHTALMVDYDVLTNGYTNPPLGDLSIPGFFCGHVPCAVFATPSQFQKCAVEFIAANCQSDMHYFERTRSAYAGGGGCIEHGQSGWREAKLIHFAHFACAPRKRSEVMREWTGVFPNGMGNTTHQDHRNNEDLAPKLAESLAIVYSVKDAVAALVEHSKKDGFAKGRVIKALTAAGFIKPKKNEIRNLLRCHAG